MRQSRNTRAAAQRPVSHGDGIVEDDADDGSAGGEVGDAQGPTGAPVELPQPSRSNKTAADPPSSKAKGGKRGGGSGGGSGGGVPVAASSTSSAAKKKPKASLATSKPDLATAPKKTASVADGSESEAEAELDRNAAATSGVAPMDEDKDEDGEEEVAPPVEHSSPPRRRRPGRKPAGAAPAVNRPRRGRPPVNYRVDVDEEEEGADGGDGGNSEEFDDDAGSPVAAPRGRKPKGKQRRGARAGGKRSASADKDKSENSLLKQFGFQSGAAEDPQAKIDWDFAGASAAGKGAKGRRGKGKGPSKTAKKRSKPDGGATTGTPLKDHSERGTGRSRGGKQLSYEEPASDLSELEGGGDEDADGGREDSEGSSEDAAFDKKRKRPAAKRGKAAKRSSEGRGARGNASSKAPKAPVRARPEPTRRSSREKPPVSYDEAKMNLGVEEEEEEDVVGSAKSEGNSTSSRDEAEEGRGEGGKDKGKGDDDVEIFRVAKTAKKLSSASAASAATAAARRRTTAAAGAAASSAASASTPTKKKGKKTKASPRKQKKATKGRRRAASSGSDADDGVDEQSEEYEDGEDGDEEDGEKADPAANAAAGRPKRGRPRKSGDAATASRKNVGRAAKKAPASGSGGGRPGSDDSSVESPSEEEDDSNSYSDSDDQEEEEEEDNRPLNVEKILARKSLLPAEWREICQEMNTDQVSEGSMWFQEDVLEDDQAFTKPLEKYLIKWNGMSYLHVSWETADDLIENTTKSINMKIRRFREREFGIELELERGDGEFFDPSLAVLDRVLDVDEVEGEETRLLVKWLGAPYSACTYELVKDLDSAGQEYAAAVEAYHRREDMNRLLKLKPTRDVKGDAPDLDKEPPVFKNGGSLRDYQREGVRWMVFNWLQRRGSILADEMGLGKTLQTVTYLSILHKEYGIRGPFLVIAPLSTVTHWQREFQTWSDMNTIVFHGDSDDREILENYEFEFEKDKALKKRDKTRLEGRRIWKSTVVVTTPELSIRPDVAALLGRKIHWAVLVVDEAHRLKNDGSKLNVVLKDSYTFDSTLLLTGTPLQNNTEELWTLLNLVHPPNFKDKDGFVEQYGDLQQAEDVAALQENIKPYLLRRMKEDVEKAVPPKEETIIEVELTEVQKQYYRAIYEQNTTFLLQGKKRAQDGPTLMNLAMQLRKCCNHPYLITGVEDAVRIQMGDTGETKEHLVKHSGKLVLLDKLLPKLKEQGHRVLLFSQFKIMLNILEDYLIASDISYGRIDGSIQGPLRQKAIDNFQAPKSDMFVMLLSTKAGGVGITLTAADTCIIYDSDWNPQNDVQAQARCHRIGQTKSVKVYRLLVAKTYEMHMFKTASKKLGLDQAVLAGSRPQKTQDKSGPTKKEVEMLLKHGAYDVFKEGEEGQASAKKFYEDGIDAILSRAVVVNHTSEGVAEGKPSNSFSKASFVSSSNDAAGTVDMNDPEFWTKCVGLTVPVEKEEKLGRRAARSGKKEYKVASDSEGGEEDEDYAANSELEDASSDDSVHLLADRRLWSHEDITELFGAMLMFGYGQWEKIRAKAGVRERSLGDVAAVCRAMVAVMLQMEAISIAQVSMKRERELLIATKLVIIAKKETDARLAKEAASIALARAHSTAAPAPTPTSTPATAPTPATTPTPAAVPAPSTASTPGPTPTPSPAPVTATLSPPAAPPSTPAALPSMPAAPPSTPAAQPSAPASTPASSNAPVPAPSSASVPAASSASAPASSNAPAPASSNAPATAPSNAPATAPAPAPMPAKAPTSTVSTTSTASPSAPASGSASGGGSVAVGGMPKVVAGPSSAALKAASAAVPALTDAQIQKSVRQALGSLLAKHHAARRAVDDIRRSIEHGKQAKLKLDGGGAGAGDGKSVAGTAVETSAAATGASTVAASSTALVVSSTAPKVSAEAEAKASAAAMVVSAATKSSPAAEASTAVVVSTTASDPVAVAASSATEGSSPASATAAASAAAAPEAAVGDRIATKEETGKDGADSNVAGGGGGGDGVAPVAPSVEPTNPDIIDKLAKAALALVAEAPAVRATPAPGASSPPAAAAPVPTPTVKATGTAGPVGGAGPGMPGTATAAKKEEVGVMTVSSGTTPAAATSAGGDVGAGASVVRARKNGGAAAKKVDENEEIMSLLNQTWKPRHMRNGSKFRAGLTRISAKLSLLDEIEDLSLMLKSKNPPFGRMMALHVPEGWGAEHDRWLARSAHELGWFTSMQKKRALKILEDPYRTWPGLISMPDHVVIGRRLRAIVIRFREEKRLAAREAARAAQMARERKNLDDIRERNRVFKMETDARIKKEWEARQIRIAREREAATKEAASIAAAQLAQYSAVATPTQDSTSVVTIDGATASIKEANLKRPTPGAGAGAGAGTAGGSSAAAASSSAAAGAGAAAAGGVSSSSSNNNNRQQRRVVYARNPPVVPFLPAMVKETSPNVQTVFDSKGKLSGYKVWPSEEALRAAMAWSKDRIRGLAGIGVPGGDGAAASSGGAAASASAANLDAKVAGEKVTQQQQKQQQQQKSHGGVDGALTGGAGGRPGPAAVAGTAPAPVVIPTLPWVAADGGAGGAGGGAGRSSGQATGAAAAAAAVRSPPPAAVVAGVKKTPSTSWANGAGGRGRVAAGPPMPFSFTSEAAAATEDGILLRHVRVLREILPLLVTLRAPMSNLYAAVHNLGVPISMLENHSSSAAAAAAALSKTPLHRVLDMSWLKLANGNDLSTKGAESIGVYLLSKAAAVTGDSCGLRLPPIRMVTTMISEKEKDALTAMLRSAAKATQLRAYVLSFTELKEIQSFAGRLGRSKELEGQLMPPWWKPDVHDAHLIIASCIYGSSSDYGVEKALKETTLEMLKANGIAASEEKENSKAGGGLGATATAAGTAEAAAAATTPKTRKLVGAGCAAAEPMTSLKAMTPKITAAAAKARIKNLHTAAYVQAASLTRASFEASVSARAASTSAAPARSNGTVVNGRGAGAAAAGAAVPTVPSVAVFASTRPPAVGGGNKVTSAKRPPPPEVVEVLDLCSDEAGAGAGSAATSSEPPAKKLKPASSPPQATAADAATTPASNIPGTVSASSPSSNGSASNSGAKQQPEAVDEGEKPKDAAVAVSGTVEKAVADAAGGGTGVPAASSSSADDGSSPSTSKKPKKIGGTLDSFWNSP